MEWPNLMSTQRQGDKVASAPGELRSRFDQDYDRIIFSHPFRKLQDKTQVFPLPEHDFVHTRLTHSLEVSSVGRSLGREVGQTLIQRHNLGIVGLHEGHFGSVVAAASLAHDIGNPPFGHSGESAISGFFKKPEAIEKFSRQMTEKEWMDLIHFEGNAQGFRMLNHEIYGGLRVTFATLATFTKYPRTSSAKIIAGRRSQKKYGIHQKDAELFENLALELGITKIGTDQYIRHPLAFLVEAADDICYHIIDLEDGCRLGLVQFQEATELMIKIIGDRFNAKKFQQMQSREEQLGLLRALTINQLIQECVAVFLENDQTMLSGNFDTALTDEIASSPTLKEIISLSIHEIYRSRQVLEREAAGFEILEKLMGAFSEAIANELLNEGVSNPKSKAIFRLLPRDYQNAIQGAEGVYEALQFLVDFVSGLTDKSAIGLYKVISGYSLPDHL